MCNAVDCGSDTANSRGTTCTSAGSANVAGSWTQIIAATGADCCGFYVQAVKDFALIDNGTTFAVDIAIGGAGNEFMVAQQLVANGTASPTFGEVYYIPVAVPSGTRLSARSQSNAASDPVNVSIILVDGTFTQIDGYSGVDAIGFVTASTHGTVITASGSTNTKGSYSQLIASTAKDYAAICLSFDGDLDNLGNSSCLLDVAIGAAASEVVIIPNISILTNSNIVYPANTPWFFIPVPSGTRLSARMQSSVSAEVVGLTAYGAYQ